VAALMFTLGFIFFLLCVFGLKVNNKNEEEASQLLRFSRSSAVILLCGSVAFALVSVVTLSQVAGAFSSTLTLGDDIKLRVSPGDTLQVLEWLAFAFSVPFVLGAQMLVGEAQNSADNGSPKSPPKAGPPKPSGPPKVSPLPPGPRWVRE
jgi:hypothetical protein